MHLVLAAICADSPEQRKWLSSTGHARMPPRILYEVKNIASAAASAEASRPVQTDIKTDLYILPVLRLNLVLCLYSLRAIALTYLHFMRALLFLRSPHFNFACARSAYRPFRVRR
jgi:hypothetical protein